MRRLLQAWLPQRYRLRLWLLRQYFTRESLATRRAQPSRLQRLVARAALAMRRGGPGDGPRGLERLGSVMLINLESRPDRLEQATAEMQRLGIHQAERFDAIPSANGALGCALSHAECLRRLLAKDWDAMMVCEDDVEFLVERSHLDALVDAFLDDASVL